ncbi:glycosyltransferase family 39 protein [Thermoflexus hugenholtzii]
MDDPLRRLDSGRGGRSRLLGPSLLIVCLYFAFANMYASALPPFEGPDAFSHFAAAVFYRPGFRWPSITAETAAIYGNELIVQPPLYYLLAGLAIRMEPSEPSLAFVRSSYNLYFGKGLSYRQSLLLPRPDPGTLRAAWIARRVSMWGGLLALLGTWRWARLLFPGRTGLPVAATAIVAYNPEFLYLSSSITNDAWTAATSVWVLALATEAALRTRGPRAWLRVGMAFGVASLTKYSAGLTAIPVAFLWALDGRQRGSRHAMWGAVWGAIGFATVAGWWFARNGMQYGELIPLRAMDQVLGLRRPQPFDLRTTLSYAPWLLASFWGVFLAIAIPERSLTLARWFTIIGLLGFLRTLGFPRASLKPRAPIFGGIILLHLLITCAGVLYWTSTVHFGEHGRFAFIGLGAFGIAMAWGWAGWAPLRGRRFLWAGILGWMLVLAIIGWLTARNAFALPPALPPSWEPQRRIDARFEGGMRLIGVDFPQGAAARPGDVVPLVLYWTTDAPILKDYTLFLHLVAEDGRMLFQFDGIPVRGGHPTRQWRPGQRFADPYRLRIPEEAQPGIAVLWAGFYPFERVERVPVYGSDGRPMGREIALARIRIAESAPALAGPEPGVIARWSDGIVLREATPLWGPEGQPVGITLVWGATRTLHQDYQVFVHVVDAQGRLLAQADHEPQQGRAPTSTWRAGDRIVDLVRWDPPGPDWAMVLVGLYQLATGERLPVLEPPVAHHALPVLRRTP